MKEGIKLDSEDNFIVKESALLNYLVAVIFFAIFIGVLITRNFEIGNPISEFYFIYPFILLPGIISLIKYSRDKAIIKVNKTGVFYYGVTVTDWSNFKTAYIGEEYPTVTQNSAGMSDKFSIVVTFFDPTRNCDYWYKMSLSGTQDKSPEQIISAINFYSGKNLSFEVFTI
ncbi:MAG: hypothetical protein JWP81_531 [Ferruginibacter sp.]|nr:hypothetical protein [Ferruginibacter sp.]